MEPAELRGVYRIPETVRVFGPWTGDLKRSSDGLVVEDKNGVIMSQVHYRDGGDWPIAADGAGHTLVLQNIHESVDDWRNWRASTSPLGTPGLPERDAANEAAPTGAAVIAEVHFASDRSVDWVEVVHQSGRLFAAGELRLASKRDFSDAVTVTGSLGSGDRTVLDLDFPSGTSARAQRLYLITSDDRVLDAREFPIVAPEESWQRWPEQSTEWYRGSAPGRGKTNHPERHDEIVINEIMYDPPAGSGGVEFIELFNRGQERVDLTGWQFTDGVEFPFPSGTQLEPGAYAVISANADDLRKIHGTIPVLGSFRGKLGNDGERLRLVDSLGNLASEVDYRTGGAWPDVAAGGGSSMELAHPAMDGRLASAWKGSDESLKTRFQLFKHTGVYEELNPLGSLSDHRELHFFMVEEGHVALRNIRLRNAKSGEDYIRADARDSRDGTGATGWLIQGNHSASHWEGDVLHLISEGHGDNRANRIEIDIPRIERGTDCELSFEARWISGSPRLIAQTWDHSFSYSTRLPVPATLGTPGQANSCVSAVPAPQLDQLHHSPVVPAPGQPVRVSVRVTTAEATARVTVFHRLDSLSGDAEWRSTLMTKEPLGPNQTATGTRAYSATLT
ncbi:MAG TPA: lamin tail domain-containing protein, partial [Verrucomicrobiae bacterium]|nr:lamin tail domain-containing protein [Verrucomicrobiae bacterium]